MIRTQVYLTEDQARDIKLRARRENKREAEVIRELLREGMKKSATKPQESTGESLFDWLPSAARAQPICHPALTIISMEKIAESPIIADTSALVSLATDTDHNHVPAKEAAARLREVSRPIILPADSLSKRSMC